MIQRDCFLMNTEFSGLMEASVTRSLLFSFWKRGLKRPRNIGGLSVVSQRGTEPLLFTPSPGLLLTPVSSLASVHQPVGTCSQTPADLAPQAPSPRGSVPKRRQSSFVFSVCSAQIFLCPQLSESSSGENFYFISTPNAQKADTPLQNAKALLPRPVCPAAHSSPLAHPRSACAQRREGTERPAHSSLINLN